MDADGHEFTGVAVVERLLPSAKPEHDSLRNRMRLL